MRTCMRAETGHRAEASTSSKPEAVFGTVAAAVALTGLATRARPGKGHRIVLLRAEGETEAKAESPGPDSKAEAG